MSADRAKLNLVGWLRQPRDLTVDGKTIPQVCRITGNPEWGFLYEIRRDNKYFKTSEPLWHNEHASRKRNDLPKFDQEVEVGQHGRVIVKDYQGFGWWRANTAEGKQVSFHFFDMIKGG